MVPSAAFYKATDTVHLTGEISQIPLISDVYKALMTFWYMIRNHIYRVVCISGFRTFIGNLVGLQSAHMTNLWVCGRYQIRRLNMQ